MLLEVIEREEQTDTKLAGELAKATINISGDVTNALFNSSIKTDGGAVHIGNNTYIQYAEESILHFLTEAPQNPPVFKGRAEQLKELHDRLFAGDGDHVILLVNGQGGVGKTSMANRYFFDYHDKYSHAAWRTSGTKVYWNSPPRKR